MDALSTTLSERQTIDILKTPESLAAFMLDPARDAFWVHQNQTQARALLNRVQFWVETGQLELSKALELRRIFHTVFPEATFTLQENDKSLKVSKLLLMEKGDWFRSYFLGGFKERAASSTSINQFSAFLNLELFERLYIFLKSENAEVFQKLEESEVFLLIQQCHMWGLFFALSQLEKVAKKHVTNAVKALESLEGARRYQLRELEAHCLNVIAKASVHLSVSSNQRLSATLTSFTDEAEEAISSVSDSLNALSTNEKALESPRAAQALSNLPKLEKLTLTLTSADISETAKSALNQCTQLHALRLQIRGGSYIAPPTSSGGNPIQFTHIEQLDLRKLPGNVQARRVALGALPLMSDLKDIRLSGCGFVDDKFLDELIRKKPDLLLIDLGSCHRVSDSKLSELLQVFSSLKVVNLKDLRVTNSTLSQALKNLHQLEHLNLSACSNLRRGLFQTHSAHLGRLKHLNLTSVHYLDEHDFDALFDSAKSLEYLCVAHARQFELSQLRGKNLSNLEEFVVSADKLEEADLTLLQTAFPNLKTLHVEGNPSPELRDNLRRFSCTVHY